MGPAKRPAYQWYPGDFRRDLALQACSWEARSLWRDMLDFMHDGEPYGHLTAGGVPLTAETLARLLGIPARKVKPLIAELEAHGVFSRTDEGVIYSRRMVRDEALRNRRAEAGHMGGASKALANGKQNASKTLAKPKQRTKQKVPPASASASALPPSGGAGAPTPESPGTDPPPTLLAPAAVQPHPTNTAMRGGWPAQVSQLLKTRGIRCEPGKAGAMLSPAVDEFGSERVIKALEGFFQYGVTLYKQQPQFVTLETFCKNPSVWVQEVSPDPGLTQ